jgi:hypothetical protein
MTARDRRLMFTKKVEATGFATDSVISYLLTSARPQDISARLYIDFRVESHDTENNEGASTSKHKLHFRPSFWSFLNIRSLFLEP